MANDGMPIEVIRHDIQDLAPNAIVRESSTKKFKRRRQEDESREDWMNAGPPMIERVDKEINSALRYDVTTEDSSSFSLPLPLPELEKSEEELPHFPRQHMYKDIKNDPSISQVKVHRKKETRYKCVPCDSSFKRLEHARRHVAGVHINTPSFVCLQCDFTHRKFDDASGIRRHMAALHGDSGSFRDQRELVRSQIVQLVAVVGETDETLSD